MKKINYLIIILSLFILLPTAYADCTDEEIQHFKEIKSEYKITYEYDETTQNYTFTFYNPEPQKYGYILYFNRDEMCEDIDDNTFKCNFPDYRNVFSIEGLTQSCDDILERLELKVPKYNEFYNDPLCEGIEEFVLCQPTYDKDIDYDTFVSRVNTYKNTKEKEESKNTSNSTNTTNNLLEYIKSNLFPVIVITAFTILTIITIVLTIQSVKKSRRLE